MLSHSGAKPPLIIFDFDGTLANTIDLVVSGFNKYAAKRKLNSAQAFHEIPQIMRKKLYRSFFFDLWSQLKAKSEIKNAVLDEMEENILDVHLVRSELLVMLFEMAKRGFRLGILTTNRESTVYKFLDNYRIRDRFEFVVSSENKKDVLNYLANVHPDLDIYYIGDQCSDIWAAKGNVKATFAVTWGYETPGKLATSHPNHLVQEPYEILAIIEKDLQCHHSIPRLS